MNNKVNKSRDFIEIADKIINVINSHSDLKKPQVEKITSEIEEIKKSYRFSAPELEWLRWEELSYVLEENFNPENSRWETEILIIFNNLSGTVDDYYKG